MSALILHGALCHRPLLATVAGAAQLRLTPATLCDHAVCAAGNVNNPVLIAAAGSKAEGLLAEGLTQAALDRLGYFQAGLAQVPRPVRVETTMGPRPARAFFPVHDVAKTAPWDFDAWRDGWADVATLAAAEVIEGFGRLSVEALRGRYPAILARAASRLRAQQGGPTTLRRRAAAGDVAVFDKSRPYARFFAVEEYALQHRRFFGGMGRALNRAAFVSCDAVTILPYDSARDRVMLIEQLRIGPFGRGDSQPWSLEAIAGRVEAGETPQEAGRREAAEEAGLRVGTLTPVAAYYPSPGANTEFIYSFIATASLPDGSAGLGGAPDEGEDIRAHLVDFPRAMDLVKTGEIDNAPLIVSLLALAALRDAQGAGQA